MKRSTNVAVAHDVPDLPISKIPPDTRVVWLVDPAVLQVGPREEDTRRKTPGAKFLVVVSALLTVMVLWGLFRQVHYMLPQMFSSGSGNAAAAITLDRIDSGSSVFQVVDDSAIGG